MPDAPRLRAGVEVIEQMGSESYVYLRLGDVKLVCRMDSHRPLKIGETITPAVNISRARFFDSSNDARIVYGIGEPFRQKSVISEDVGHARTSDNIPGGVVLSREESRD
jgi:hypothetical protein